MAFYPTYLDSAYNQHRKYPGIVARVSVSESSQCMYIVFLVGINGDLS